MGILDLSAVFLCIFPFGQVSLTVIITDKAASHLLRFLSHTGGIGTQVGDPPEIRMNSYIIKEKPGRGSYQTATAPRLSHGDCNWIVTQ